jgi:hypothetical protein
MAPPVNWRPGEDLIISHAEAGHPVEDTTTESGFSLLIGQNPSLKTPADDGLVSIHCRLDQTAAK